MRKLQIAFTPAINIRQVLLQESKYEGSVNRNLFEIVNHDNSDWIVKTKHSWMSGNMRGRNLASDATQRQNLYEMDKIWYIPYNSWRMLQCDTVGTNSETRRNWIYVILMMGTSKKYEQWTRNAGAPSAGTRHLNFSQRKRRYATTQRKFSKKINVTQGVQHEKPFPIVLRSHLS